MRKEESIPKLSKNISFHKFSDAEWFIHQKEYGYRIKISNYLKNILNKIDGKKTIKEIIEYSDDNIDVGFLYEFLHEKLGGYGIIENDLIEVTRQSKPNYLKLSFIVLAPKVVSSITPFLKPLFNPKVMSFLICSCFLVIVYGLFFNLTIILNYSLNDLWIGLFILGFLSVTFHEFGHVTAAEYFGAEHGGIGGGFYLLSPVYFADVTDIWKLKPKQRIIVNIAGIYFELIICTLFVLIGFLWGIKLMSITGLIIFVKTLFNLNPFMRSDGYWVLTDILGIPNLYYEANFNLRRIIFSIFLRKKEPLNLKMYLLALYASVNYLLIIVFLYIVIFKNSDSVIFFPINFYNYIVDIFQGTQSIKFDGFTRFLIPFIFYYLLLKFIISYLGKFYKTLTSKLWTFQKKHKKLQKQ